MKKIISLFQRNYDGDHLVRNEVVPGAEWVLAGEGTATRKFDGTCCLVRAGMLYKRRELKKGQQCPERFETCQTDETTGKTVGWVPVTGAPEDKWHVEAFQRQNGESGVMEDGTYELVGPNIQGNPEKFEMNFLIRHGDFFFERVPLSFDGLRGWLKDKNYEGIVWHHPDGRMVKIKRKDFFR